MTLFFPDLNVWLALSVLGHVHNSAAWAWWNGQSADRKLIFSRYTQLGLLGLLTSPAVMGDAARTLAKAWGVYDRWLGDPKVEFYPEPRNLEATFRKMTKAYGAQPATKAVGACFLLAYTKGVQATLVTFEEGLDRFARKHGQEAVIPARNSPPLPALTAISRHGKRRIALATDRESP